MGDHIIISTTSIVILVTIIVNTIIAVIIIALTMGGFVVEGAVMEAGWLEVVLVQGLRLARGGCGVWGVVVVVRFSQ